MKVFASDPFYRPANVSIRNLVVDSFREDSPEIPSFETECDFTVNTNSPYVYKQVLEFAENIHRAEFKVEAGGEIRFMTSRHGLKRLLE